MFLDPGISQVRALPGGPSSSVVAAWRRSDAGMSKTEVSPIRQALRKSDPARGGCAAEPVPVDGLHERSHPVPPVGTRWRSP